MASIDEKDCMFKERYRFDKCRSCDGIDHCEFYLPRVTKRYTPMIVRQERQTKILPKNYQDWIRRGNDSGVIG